MFDAGWDERVRREWEDERSDGRRVRREERSEEREVFRGDYDGDGHATETELVCEVEKSEHVAMGWVWEHQDVGVGFAAGVGGHGGRLMAEIRRIR